MSKRSLWVLVLFLPNTRVHTDVRRRVGDVAMNEKHKTAPSPTGDALADGADAAHRAIGAADVIRMLSGASRRPSRGFIRRELRKPIAVGRNPVLRLPQRRSINLC